MMRERRLPDGRLLPADFSEQDIELATQLNSAFCIEREELPPLFTQTLLNEGNYAPTTEDFEQRLVHRVFQAIEVPHPSAIRRAKPVMPVAKNRTLARKLLVATLAVTFLLAATATSSGAALASVLHYFFVGRGGADVVSVYPTQLSANPPQTQAAQSPDHLIRLTPMWPGAVSQGYTFQGVDVFDSQWWSNGALVSLRYEKTDKDGVHRLTIMEFMPTTHEALQVVQDGAISRMPVGAANGIFVAGHWVHTPRGLTWSPDQRAELICGDVGEPGLVVWIAADDLKTFNKDAVKTMLRGVAESLKPLRFSDLPAAPDSIRYRGNELTHNTPFGNDVIALVPSGSMVMAPAILIKVAPSTETAGDNPADSIPTTLPR